MTEAYDSNSDIHVQTNSSGVEELVFDPYNPLNQQITDDEIHTILRTYGVNVDIFNFTLYRRAFIHRSYTKQPDLDNMENKIRIVERPPDCLPLSTRSNERLEFVGDGVLECITKYYLYCRFPKEDEGFMTDTKIALVKNESIGRIAYEMGLHKWLILSKHAEAKNTRTNMKKLGCLFEAFLGAIFLDFNKIDIYDNHGWFPKQSEQTATSETGNAPIKFRMGPGIQMAQVFLENVFERHVDWTALVQTNDNYKNQLQVRIQKEFKVTPHYIEMSEHNIERGYHMGVYLCLGQEIHETPARNALSYTNFGTFTAIHTHMATHGRILVFLGEGIHKTKKKAEQIACSEALNHLASF
jgi:dsRNA-specific ribonuclease